MEQISYESLLLLLIVILFLAQRTCFGCFLQLSYSTWQNITLCKRMLCKNVPSLRKPSVPETGPGAKALTLTPLGPHSTARCLVIASADK